MMFMGLTFYLVWSFCIINRLSLAQRKQETLTPVPSLCAGDFPRCSSVLASWWFQTISYSESQLTVKLSCRLLCRGSPSYYYCSCVMRPLYSKLWINLKQLHNNAIWKIYKNTGFITVVFQLCFGLCQHWAMQYTSIIYNWETCVRVSFFSSVKIQGFSH